MAAMPIPQLSPEINPVISNEIFAEHPEAAFWIGIVASEGTIEQPVLYDAAAQLRANVYVGEMGFLGIDHVDEDGREQDGYDDQSIHLVAVENTGPDTATVIGASRIILKKDGTDTLPIETDFSEIFETVPTDIPAVEISRFISRHPNQMLQHVISVSLIRAMTYQILKNTIDTAYFEIEKPLLKLLGSIGLPLEIMADPKEVVEPRGVSVLHPIKISVSQVPGSVGKDASGQVALREFFKGEEGNGGLGYFPATMVGGK